jgi:hypothetical protein
MCPQEIAQLTRITHNEAEVTSSNPPPPLLCKHVKRKKEKRKKKVIQQCHGILQNNLYCLSYYATINYFKAG